MPYPVWPLLANEPLPYVDKRCRQPSLIRPEQMALLAQRMIDHAFNLSFYPVGQHRVLGTEKYTVSRDVEVPPPRTRLCKRKYGYRRTHTLIRPKILVDLP